MLFYTTTLSKLFYVLNLHLCSSNGCFWSLFFSSIKEINRLLKEINRLLRKRMSNIYLKVAIEKKWCIQNFDLEV